MIPDLTEREAEIIRLRDEGLSLAAVAERLGTSKGSVSSSERAAKLKMATPDLLKQNEQTPGDVVDNPYAIVEEAARQCGIPRTTAQSLIKRLKAHETPSNGALRKMQDEQLIEVLEDRILHAFEYLDDVALSRASTQQLATTAV